MKNKSKIMEKMLKDKEFRDFLSDRGDIYANYCDYISDNLKVEDIVKDKKFLKEYVKFGDFEDDVIDYLEDYHRELKPARTTKENYIGIELECFTEFNHIELLEKIMEHGLDKMVQPTSDSSIEPDFGDDCELRVLLPEKKLGTGLKKLSKLLSKGKFGVNNSCGLHIHLDMRNRDVDECHKRLLKFQDILFGMVKKERWNNSFCAYSSKFNKLNRYVAINKENAYAAHKTIEIRLHHATLDMKNIEKWVKLLLRVIDTNTPPPKENKADVVKWAKTHRGLGTYVAKTFNDKWFEEKKKWVSGGDGNF